MDWPFILLTESLKDVVFLDDNGVYSFIMSALPKRISTLLREALLSGKIFEEIRLRRNMPVSVTCKGKSYFISSGGEFSLYSENPIYCLDDEFENALLILCENSVFAHTKEIENGYISAPGGIRVGVCGDFSPSLSGIVSANIRIPRQIKGCADEVFFRFSGGMLLAGPPCSGKTTMLRELIRKLSLSGYRICVIDSRREISGGMIFDLGPNTDAMYVADRAFGAASALKTMYPQIIAFDEIGTLKEAQSVLEAFNSGVYILTTAHASSVSELTKRPATGELIASGVLKTIVLLSKNIGEKPRIYDVQEIINEIDC